MSVMVTSDMFPVDKYGQYRILYHRLWQSARPQRQKASGAWTD